MEKKAFEELLKTNWNKLTAAQKEQVKGCKTAEDLKALLPGFGIELPEPFDEDALDIAVGGFGLNQGFTSGIDEIQQFFGQGKP